MADSPSPSKRRSAKGTRTTGELTVTNITRLQEELAPFPSINFNTFAHAYQSVIGEEVDLQFLRLTFELVDGDSDGWISWGELQQHIASLRRDETVEEDIVGMKECFSEASHSANLYSKVLHHSGRIRRILAPPKLDVLVTTSLDGSVRMWDRATLDYKRTLHYGNCACLDADYDPLTDILAVITTDQVVSLYTLGTPKLLRTLRAGKPSLQREGIPDEVYRKQFRVPKNTPKFMHQGKQVEIIEGSTLDRFWRAKHGMILQRVWARKKHIEHFNATMIPQTNDLSSVTVCRTDDPELLVRGPTDAPPVLLFCGMEDGGVHGYKLRLDRGAAEDDSMLGNTLAPVITWKPHTDAITCMRTDRDADLMITSSKDSDIQILNLERGMILRTLKGTKIETLRSHTRGVSYFEYSKSPKLLGSWGNERYAIVWDPAVAKPLQTLHGHVARIVDMKFAQDNQIFTYSEDRTIRIWDLRTFRCLQQIREHSWETFGQPGAIFYDAKRSAIITGTHRLYWKEAIKGAFSRDYAGHRRAVLATSYCEKQQMLCSCDETSLRVWNTATHALTVWWNFQQLRGICVDHDGHGILVDVEGKELYVVSATNAQQILVLTSSKEHAAEDNHDPRYLYWDAKHLWVIATSRLLLFYEDATDHRVVMYPTPTYTHSLSSLKSQVSCMLVVEQRLVLGLADGGMTSVSLRYMQTHSDERLFPFDRMTHVPPLVSILSGPLHAPLRQMVKQATQFTLLWERNSGQRTLRENVFGDEEEAGDGGASHAEASDQANRAVFANVEDFSNRLECLASLSSRFVASSTAGGVFSIWDLPESKEVLRWSVALGAKTPVFAIDTFEPDALLFYGDDMGYVGTLKVDLSNSRMDSSCVSRLSLFRAANASIASVRFLAHCRHLSIASADNTILLADQMGARICLLGSTEACPDAPRATKQYEMVMHMFRMELIMQQLDAHPMKDTELVAWAATNPFGLFPDPKLLIEALKLMCPAEAERDNERLLDYNSDDHIYVALQPKQISNEQRASPRAAAAPKAKDYAAGYLVHEWNEMGVALATTKKPKPFRRQILEHVQLLRSTSPAEEPAVELPPTREPAITAQNMTAKQHHTSSSSVRKMASKQETDAVGERQPPTSQQEGGAQVVTATFRPAPIARVRSWWVGARGCPTTPDKAKHRPRPREDEPLDKHEEYARSLVLEEEAIIFCEYEHRYVESTESAYRDDVVRGTAAALRQLELQCSHDSQLVSQCVSPEVLSRCSLLQAEVRWRGKLQSGEEQENKDIVELVERPNLLHFLTLEDIGVPVSLGSSIRQTFRSSGVAATPDPLRDPVLCQKRASSTSIFRRESRQKSRRSGSYCGRGRPLQKAKAHSWDALPPYLSADPSTSWTAAFVDALDGMACTERMQEARSDRVASVVHSFSTASSLVVTAIVDGWDTGTLPSGVRQVSKYQWYGNGVSYECPSNPIAGRVCGKVSAAAKLAGHELRSLAEVVRAMESVPLRLHTPLCCVVKYMGLTFFCSSILPCAKHHEIPFTEKEPRNTCKEILMQAYDTLRVNSPCEVTAMHIPCGMRRYVGPTGHRFVTGARRLYPPQWNTTLDKDFPTNLLRPELVRAGVAHLASNVFDPRIPSAKRAKADKDATRATRRVTATLIPDLVDYLMHLEPTVTQLAKGRIVDELHKRGINLRFLFHVVVAMNRQLKESSSSMSCPSECANVVRGNARVGRQGTIEKALQTHLIHRRWNDESRRGEEDSGAVLSFRLALEELVARTFRHLLSCAIRHACFGLPDALANEVLRDFVPTTLPTRQPSKGANSVKSQASCIASCLLSLLLSQETQGMAFWEKAMDPTMFHLFPSPEHNTVQVRLHSIDATRLMGRISALCGITFKGDVATFAPTIKSFPDDVVARTLDRGWHVKHEERIAAMWKCTREEDVRCCRGLKRTPERVSFVIDQLRLTIRAKGEDGSLPLFDEAIKLTSSFFGSSSAGVGCAHELYALLMFLHGKHEVAIRMLQAAVSCYKPVEGSSTGNPAALARAYQMLCQTYAAAGVRHCGYASAKELLAHVRNSPGPLTAVTDLDVADALRWVAEAQLDRSNDVLAHRGARDLLEESFHCVVAAKGRQHPWAIAAFCRIAEAHVILEEEQEAVELYERVIQQIQAEEGPNSAQIAPQYDRIGEIRQRQNCFDAAIKSFQSGLTVRERAFGSQGAPLAISYRHLALCCLQWRQGSEALNYISRGMKLLDSTPFDDPILAETLEAFARCSLASGDVARALDVWLKLLDTRERRLGPMDSQTADAMFEIATLFFAQGKYHESWHAFDVCGAIREKLFGAVHPSVTHTIISKARCEGAMGNAVEAANLFERALSQLRRTATTDNKDTVVAAAIKPQLLFDAGTLLLADATTFESVGIKFDLQRLQSLGMAPEVEISHALEYFREALQVCTNLQQDHTHPTVRAAKSKIQACEQALVRLDKERRDHMEGNERLKLLDMWTTKEDNAKTKDPAWYRKSHKLYRLHNAFTASPQK